MKSTKLQDAIGMIDADLIESANRIPATRKKHRIIKWSASIAAMLAIAFAIGIFFGHGSPFSTNVYAVSKAKYPEMADYPSGIGLVGIGQGYENWRMDQKTRASFFGHGKNLTGFISATASEILSGSKAENRIYSPLNIYMALAMLAEITDGESRQQILTLLNAESIDALREQAYAVWNANYNDDGSVTSILASSLWLNEAVSFNKDTLKTLSEKYYASSYQGDMSSIQFSQAMREWINEQTGGLLKDQLSDIDFSPETIMAIATTILFEAKWDSEFSKSQTKKNTFHSANGDTEMDFMNITDIYGHYYWGECFSATSKSLENSGSMWFILPDEGVTIDELLADEQALAFLASGNDWENEKSLIVNLSVPKFDVKSKLEISENLKNLGITDCFQMGTSDFSPLLQEKQPIVLSRVNHGARVKIDEEGVVGAAYTEMMLAGSAAPPSDEIDFVVDRPFLFVITGEDRLPLFIGVVNQP